MDKLTIIIPAYNEEKALALFLPELISFCQANGCSLIIVNDGSKDNIAALLAEFDKEPFFTPLQHKINRGYGGALKSGLCAAETEYVITIDAGFPRPQRGDRSPGKVRHSAPGGSGDADR